MPAERDAPAGPRAASKRDRIVEAALRAFAERGYQGAKVEDVAAEVGVSKGSVFQHFGSKAGLFFEAYRRAVASLPRWLDAPDDVIAAGFWAVLAHRLARTEHLTEDDRIPYRVTLVGNYGTDLVLRREINRYLATEDPYGTRELVAFGIERGDVRRDIDVETAASMLDWLTAGFQDAVVTKESDASEAEVDHGPERELRTARLVELLRRAMGADGIGA